MINSIELKNFQSHKNTELNFVEGLNVIIGKTDSGKSSILRAINYIINNRPITNNYLNKYLKKEEKKEFIIKIDDITRIKSEKENKYLIKNKENALKAFGTEVPEEIKNYFSFNILNYQSQLEAPFLLSKSSGEIAKFLNKIIKLDKIDKSLKNIESIKRKYKNEYERKEKEEEKLKEEIKKYDWLDTFEIDLNKLKKKEEKIKKLEDRLIIFEENLKKYKSNKILLDKINKNLKFEKEINYLVTLSKDIKEKEKLFEKYNDKYENLLKIKENIKIYNKKIGFEKEIKDLINFYNEKIFKNEEKYNIIKNKIEIFNKNKIKLDKMSKEISSLGIKLKKEFGDFCPLCGRGIKH